MFKQPSFELSDYLHLMQEKAMSNLRHQNTSYIELKEQEENFIELLESILDKMEEKDKEVVERYHAILDIIQCQELDHCYFAGYKDCISMFKCLGVL